ncbi:hypothetical protein C5O80_08250 [Burkholderia sp. SRS-46]|nr:hypothetical protein C5O80_08250 [Burkholderia sp. SRS-46]
MPLITHTSSDMNEGDLELLVLDSANLNVRQRLRLPGRMADDAVRILSVTFDTARYQVAAGRTAFGLRLGKAGSSRPNPFDETDLWLYTLDGDRIKPVLDGIVVADNGGEWDTQCAGAFSRVRRTLAIDSAAHNGFADILVTEQTTSSRSTIGTNGQCLDKEDKPRRTTYRLIFNGTRYDVPKALRPL